MPFGADAPPAPAAGPQHDPGWRARPAPPLKTPHRMQDHRTTLTTPDAHRPTRDCETKRFLLARMARLLEACDPFAAPPWAEVATLSVADVRQAMRSGLLQPQSYSTGERVKTWTKADHIARIAYLAMTGWSAPIEVDVGVPSMNCWVDWPVIDGNHRLAAAMVRGDEFIRASVAGSCDYMVELLAPLCQSENPPSHADRWQG